MNHVNAVEQQYIKFYHDQPLIVRSPGRVNLIGEHTDYNLGYVLPGAIDKAMYLALGRRSDTHVCLHAIDLHDCFEFAIDDLNHAPTPWANYLIGVVAQMTAAGHTLTGFNCVFGGDIPIGAGLSSSAAIEAGLAFGLNQLFDLNIDPLSLVKMAQKAENEFVGVQCGIMDQYINIFGREGNLLKIDCRSLEYEYVPFHFDDISIVLFNTNVSHSLASSEYNQRRRECGEGVAVIRRRYPEVRSLRDVTPGMLAACRAAIDPIVYQRCTYVVDEYERLLDACDALMHDDVKRFGQAMFRTHHGLSQEYGVSCPELDYLVELVEGTPEVFGARMMGGGFGGCTINLVSSAHVARVSDTVARQYEQKFGRAPATYITSIAPGTQVLRKGEHAAV
jgi:galactokinase